MKVLTSILSFMLLLAASCSQQQSEEQATVAKETFATPLGIEKAYSEPSQKLLDQYRTAVENYEENPDDPEYIIWLGRRTAYMGRYEEAIKVYSDGIQLFPDNPKFYRHRGHRYISIREYDKAIADFEKAASLIEGTENEIEADGMPNARNIPVSSLHGNIYYHLGLAYYLVQDFPKAYEAYLKCRNTANNPDNLVSSTNWLYMIQRRMNNQQKADSTLIVIEEGFDIIENHDYYRLCLLYKGVLPIDSLNPSGDSPSSDAIKYGLANWHFYNNDKAKAKELFQSMMEGSSWTSFGYLAAESDLQKAFD
jgi:tetratricopeptide (TPR) repeat protein